MRRAVLVSLAVAASLSMWLVLGDTFMVGSGLQGPPTIAAGPQGWSRGCWGVAYERTVVDTGWTRCLGVPYGPRRCVGYPPLSEGADMRSVSLPLGPLREIQCPRPFSAR